MDRTLIFFRGITRWLGPALAVLIVGVVVIGSAHHHDALDGHHPCAVCTAAHAPAVAASSAPTPSATACVTRSVASPDLEPRARLAVRGIASRAPPIA